MNNEERKFCTDWNRFLRPSFYTNIYIDSEKSDVFSSSVTVIVVRRPLLVHLEEVK